MGSCIEAMYLSETDLSHLNMANKGKKLLNIPCQISFNLLKMKDVQLQLQIGMVDAP